MPPASLVHNILLPEMAHIVKEHITMYNSATPGPIINDLRMRLELEHPRIAIAEQRERYGRPYLEEPLARLLRVDLPFAGSDDTKGRIKLAFERLDLFLSVNGVADVRSGVERCFVALV